MWSKSAMIKVLSMTESNWTAQKCYVYFLKFQQHFARILVSIYCKKQTQHNCITDSWRNCMSKEAVYFYCKKGTPHQQLWQTECTNTTGKSTSHRLPGVGTFRWPWSMDYPDGPGPWTTWMDYPWTTLNGPPWNLSKRCNQSEQLWFNPQTFPTIASGPLSQNVWFKQVFLLLPTW